MTAREDQEVHAIARDPRRTGAARVVRRPCDRAGAVSLSKYAVLNTSSGRHERAA